MDDVTNSQDQIRQSVESYRLGTISRRDLLRALITATGSYATAHLFLESSGLAQSVVSPREAEAANVNAESVEYPSDNATIQAYLARPKTSGKHPGIVVIHENRGLNEHIRDIARRFAAEGYVALAPDLLSRVGGTGAMKTPADATEAINKLPLFDTLDDLKAGLDYLGKHAEVDSAKLNSIGFCWGGWRSFTLATMAPNLTHAVVFYGSSPDTGFERIRGKVLAHYAEWDYRITGNALWTEEQMKKAGKSYQYHVYPQTEHAFFNDTGPRHVPDASKLAWQRTLDFLRQ